MDHIWHPKVVHMDKCSPFLDYGEQWSDFSIFLGQFGKDEEVECIVRKKQNRSSDRQRRYYWGVIVHIISEFTGEEPDVIHTELKKRFLKKFCEKLNCDVTPSTEKLTTAERERYHQDCRRWGSVVLNLNIPGPNEVA